MNLLHYALGWGMILSFSVASAQDNYFPPDDFIPGWKGSPVEKIGDAGGLFEYMDGGAELYLEYRFAGLQVKEYTDDEGGSLTIELYSYALPQDAFGIFSIDTTGTEVDIGNGGRRAGAMTRFWKGGYYSRVFCWTQKPESESLSFTAAKRLAEKLPEAPPLPDNLSRLQKAGYHFAFLRGEIALRQVAGLRLPQDAFFDADRGAYWIFPQDKCNPGALVLLYAQKNKADESRQAIWRTIVAGAANHARVGSRGIAENKDGSFSLAETFTTENSTALIWVPKAMDETTLVEFVEGMKSTLNSIQE